MWITRGWLTPWGDHYVKFWKDECKIDQRCLYAAKKNPLNSPNRQLKRATKINFKFEDEIVRKGARVHDIDYFGNGNHMMNCVRVITDHLPGHCLYPNTIKKALIPSHGLFFGVLTKAAQILYIWERLSICYIPRRLTNYLTTRGNTPTLFSCTFLVSKRDLTDIHISYIWI